MERMEKPKPPPPKPEPKPKTQQCTKCDKPFPVSAFKGHKCVVKRAPECKTCKRKFQTAGACTNHEKACKSPASITYQKKPKIPTWMKSELLPMEVRLMRCDPLCDESGRCRDASFVDHDYGLDKSREYPYLYNLSMLKHKLRIKSELAMYDRMVKIQDGITDVFNLNECYTHWDSASESDSDTDMFKSKSKNDVKSLSTLSLKVLFSPKCLGKVPKKLRKIKSEIPFDSILNSTELDSDIKFGISNIINSLEDSLNENDNSKDYTNNKNKIKDEDALFGDNKGPGVKNSDFDLLFGNASGSADCSKEKLSSRADVGNRSPTLDLSDVDSRLSNVGDNSNAENTDASSEIDSFNKSKSECLDKMDSRQTSAIVSPSHSVNKDSEESFVTEEKEISSKENVIQKNGEQKEQLSHDGDRNNINSVVNEEKNCESDNEVKKAINMAESSNHDNEIIDYGKISDCESSNSELHKDNTAQNEVHTKSKVSANGDSDFSDKLNMEDVEAVSDTDLDDGKLMEAIDAQLGENDNKKAMVSDNFNSKVQQESEDFSKDIEY